MLDIISKTGTSPLISGSANWLQLYNTFANTLQLSSDEMLKQMIHRIDVQDDAFLIETIQFLQRIIIDNEQIQKQNLETMNQNTLIIKQNDELSDQNILIIKQNEELLKEQRLMKQALNIE